MYVKCIELQPSRAITTLDDMTCIEVFGQPSTIRAGNSCMYDPRKASKDSVHLLNLGPPMIRVPNSGEDDGTDQAEAEDGVGGLNKALGCCKFRAPSPGFVVGLVSSTR